MRGVTLAVNMGRKRDSSSRGSSVPHPGKCHIKVVLGLAGSVLQAVLVHGEFPGVDDKL